MRRLRHVLLAFLLLAMNCVCPPEGMYFGFPPCIPNTLHDKPAAPPRKTLRIAGVVLDAENGHPLPDALVTIEFQDGTSVRVNVDQEGRFETEVLKASRRILVTAPGREVEVTRMALALGEGYWHDFRLRKSK